MPAKPSEKVNYRALVDNVEIAWIPMLDGRKLAARLLLPKDADKQPVPVILEYLPYRRRDGTRVRDDDTTGTRQTATPALASISPAPATAKVWSRTNTSSASRTTRSRSSNGWQSSPGAAARSA